MASNREVEKRRREFERKQSDLRLSLQTTINEKEAQIEEESLLVTQLKKEVILNN